MYDKFPGPGPERWHHSQSHTYGLAPSQLKVFQSLLLSCVSKVVVRTNHKELSLQLGMHISTAATAMRRLKTLGLIEVERTRQLKAVNGRMRSVEGPRLPIVIQQQPCCQLQLRCQS